MQSFYPAVNGYTQQLAVGTYNMYWGDPQHNMAHHGTLCRVFAIGNNECVVVAYNNDIHVLGSMVWPLGPNEMLVDPVRVLTDSEQPCGEGKRLTELGIATW